VQVIAPDLCFPKRAAKLCKLKDPSSLDLALSDQGLQTFTELKKYICLLQNKKIQNQY
jgi:hypothetical protein